MSTRYRLQADPPPHPLAQLFPRPSDDDYLELKKSIRQVGLIEPITLHEDQVLDGLSRLRACREVGVEPEYVNFVGSDPLAFVLAMNKARRHLSESQRALLAANLVTMSAESGRPPLGQADARRLAGVGETSVTQALRVKKHAAGPELEKMINDGEVTVSAAAQVARLSPTEQKKVIAAGPKSVTRKASQLRKTGRGPSVHPPTRRFDAQTEEILRDLRNLACKLTRHIQTSDGKRFEQYARKHFPGWIDYGRVKLVDDGDGIKRVPATFVALQPLYRLLVAGARDRAYPR